MAPCRKGRFIAFFMWKGKSVIRKLACSGESFFMVPATISACRRNKADGVDKYRQPFDWFIPEKYTFWHCCLHCTVTTQNECIFFNSLQRYKGKWSSKGREWSAKCLSWDICVTSEIENVHFCHQVKQGRSMGEVISSSKVCACLIRTRGQQNRSSTAPKHK